jgi:hypothetical protein
VPSKLITKLGTLGLNPSHPHWRGCCGAGRELQVPWFHITKDLTWSTHTCTVVKRVQQRLFSLEKLKRFVMGPRILKRFYSFSLLRVFWLAALLQMHRPWQQITTEGGADSPVHHWGWAPYHPGHLYQAESEEGLKNYQRPQPPKP